MLPETEVRVVGASEADEGRGELPRFDPPVEETPGKFNGLGAEPAPGKELGRVLVRPATIAPGIEQDQVRHPFGVAQGVLERYVAAEGVA